jgi:hypothetical protein
MLHKVLNIMGGMKSVWYIARRGMRNAYKILVGKLEGTKAKVQIVKKYGMRVCTGFNWPAFENSVINLRVP